MRHNYPGKFIVLYGINNLGKTTQAKLLVEKLKAEGHCAEYIKYPIYGLEPSGSMLNDYLRHGNPYGLDAREAQIIYALNRFQYQDELLRKLDAGTIVVAEDYKGTGIAWGLGADVEEEFLRHANEGLLREDLVFLFDGERFTQGIEDGHKHENDNDLINKVRWAHLKLGEEKGWIKINANLSIEDISDIMWEVVSHELSEKKGYACRYGSSFQAVGEIINTHQLAPKAELIPKKGDKPAQIIENNPTVVHNVINVNQDHVNQPGKAAEEPILKAQRLRPEAKLPARGREGDAAFDLFSTEYRSLAPYEQASIPTGIRLEIPAGHVGLIWDKSGLASEGMKTMGGVIDPNYRGEVKVVMKNLGEDIYHIVPGQKIAQIIIQPAPQFPVEEGEIGTDTDRGEQGFGSSGKF